MKRIIRLTESDLTRIVKRVIKESEKEDDYKDRSMYDPYYGDEEWGETDRGEEDLQDLLEEARDILENDLGMSIDAINEMDEWYILDVLHEHMYDELAYEIEHLLEKEGFDSEGELDEGWDDFIQKKRYPEEYKPENYRKLPKDAFISGGEIDREGTIITKRREDPFDEYEDFDDEEYA